MSLNYAHSPFDLRSVSLPLSMPWVAFDKLWTSVMGYPAEKFRIDLGKTPMTTRNETAFVIVLYYIIVLSGREIMRKRPALKLNDLFLIHNFTLTMVSAALLILFVEQLIPTIWKHGIYYGICGAGGWTKQLATLYYVRPGRSVSLILS